MIKIYRTFYGQTISQNIFWIEEVGQDLTVSLLKRRCDDDADFYIGEAGWSGDGVTFLLPPFISGAFLQ